MSYRILVILSFTICIVSCDSFLAEDPKSFVTPEEFFFEENDAYSAVNAIYSHLNGESIYARYHWLVQSLMSDDGFTNAHDPNLHHFSDFTLTSDNPVVSEIWNGLYAAIHTANFAIENVPKAPISIAESDLLIAEARFLRGVFYLDLVRYFGGVPIQTVAITDINDVTPVERDPVDSVYALIERDFQFALEVLPETRSDNRPNSFVAAAYLAQTFTSKHEYAKALPYSRAVILSENFALLENYGDVFRIANNYSSEILFTIPLSTQSPGPVNVRSMPFALNGRSLEIPTPGLFGIFNTTDPRMPATFVSQVLDPDSNVVAIAPHVIKFWDSVVEPQGGPTANNLPLLRYADVLLLHAEIVSEINNSPATEARFAYNLVRDRANLPAFSGAGIEQFREDLLEERRRELAWEGHRWFDLKRFGKLLDLVTIAKPDVQVLPRHELLPIPQSEIDLNPLLTQNPGY